MRRLVLLAILGAGVFYAPLPLIAQKGGGQAPLIPVADMPTDSGGVTAPAEPPLEVDADEVPELVPPQQVGGGAEAPSATPAPAPERAPATTAPPPEPAPAPPPLGAEPAQETEEPAEEEEPVGEVPDDAPTAPAPEEDETDEEEFEEEFDDIPEAGDPDAPAAQPRVTAGPQLPRTGSELPPLVLSGLALTAAGMSLRALCSGRA